MSDHNFLEGHHVIKGTTKAIDFLAGTVYTDIVNMENWKDCLFVVTITSGATGTHRFAVHSVDDLTPTSTHGMPCRYRSVRGTTGSDVMSAWTVATSSGFTDTAGGLNKIYEIHTASADLYEGDKYLRLCSSEIVNDPNSGGVLICLFSPRYAEDVNASVLS